MTPSPRRDSGFTLVELLVSLALLSLMTVYALKAFYSLRDFDRVADRIAAQAEVEAVASHLREAVADARAVFASDASDAPRLLFKGSGEVLQFVAASDGSRETGGLIEVSYGLDSDGTLFSERHILRAAATSPANRVILLRGVTDLSFRYWNGAATGEGETADAWPENDRLPDAIEVRVTFADSDLRRWPPTLVRLAAGYR
jgi:general secretion pathway protein J